MNDILIIGFHTYEKFNSKNTLRKQIDNYDYTNLNYNIYHIAISYNNYHYLFCNKIMITKIKTKDYNQAYANLVELLAGLQTIFRFIDYWGHAWGTIFGTPTTSSITMSCYNFAEPLCKNNIRTYLLLLEGCNLGNIITLLDCYKLASYIIGASNSYGSRTFLKHLPELDFSNEKKIIQTIKTIYKYIDPTNTYSIILYKTQYVNKLIEYLKKINLTNLNWSDKANILNIKKDDANIYDIYKISKDLKLHKILDKIVVLKYKNCNVNIDKHIYTNVYEQSKQNTYYKILSPSSKKFYLSNPCTYTP
jgi:hypothetical protein